MIIPVVLAGGAGSRLWPISREGHPKPFIKLSDGESLLQKTYQRASEICTRGEILTVTNRDYLFQSKDEFLATKLPECRAHFILEPVGRNTAPAIAAAALSIHRQHGDDAVMVVIAADHLIKDTVNFVKATQYAAKLARAGHIVTFGISPSAPETGFGYIECGDPVDGGPATRVLRFVEKPDAATAEKYLETNRYLWNSGMFCFTVGTILGELAKYAPEVLEQVGAALESAPLTDSNAWVIQELDVEKFAGAPDISIDYAVMERSDLTVVVPATFDWSDIGSWNALKHLVAPDAQGNRAIGDVIFADCQNTYIQSEGRLIAAVGVQNLIVVETPDAVLVVHPDHVQDVKRVVQELRNVDHETYKLHRTVSRPWGTYTVLEEGKRFKIKRIIVKPGAALSLQMHHHRSEHWIVVQGMAKVVNGEDELYVNTNESTYIPAGHRHRLENPGILDLVMIEVQSGEYLGEGDIVRFEDQYGRVT